MSEVKVLLENDEYHVYLMAIRVEGFCNDCGQAELWSIKLPIETALICTACEHTFLAPQQASINASARQVARQLRQGMTYAANRPSAEQYFAAKSKKETKNAKTD